MPAFRAVLFDFFGTLTRAVQRGSRHALVADALGCNPAALADVLDRSYYLRATGALGCAEATMRWVSEQSGARPSESAVRAAVAARLDAVRADTQLRADAVAALRALRRQGIRTGLVSDCTHELPAFLPQLPVDPLLDVRVFSVHLGRCKPDPALYLTACGGLGVTPQQCLYVGDGGSRELTGAVATGMTAVRLAAPDLAGHLVFNADTGWHGPCLTSLTDVVELVSAGAGALAGTPDGLVVPDRWPDRSGTGGGPDTSAPGTGGGSGTPESWIGNEPGGFTPEVGTLGAPGRRRFERAAAGWEGD